ncbi:cation:proton antiporter [Blastomonas sp. CCH15-G10]|uniref:cation:proton antiporter domain-containing protein n=1 Tax=Blastomonas sp. CCH15-G10 TaxID=1768746 RepID=UPI000824A30C|nr:cation:proton antiporter [Blastomonas sp. CCH15-G10]
MHTPFENPVFSDALVILGAAGIVIPAFARLRINPVIGFILVGMLVGPSGLGSIVDQFPWLYHITITDREAIDPFAEFGIVMLLFTIGLELSFKRLWAMRVQVFGLGSAQLLASGLVIGFALNLIGQPLAGALGLGMALALSSTALVLPMVGTTGPVGRSALAMLIFEDLALVPIIFALGALAPRAEAAGLDGLVQTLWLGGLTIVIMLLAGRYLLPYLFAQAARTKSPELFLAACLLVVITASVATAAAGLSPIVGALIAGVMIAETEYGDEVEIITAPFKGLALGVFLITVGMSVDLRVVAANWQSLAIAVVGVWRGVAAETGVLMASPAETTLIVLAAAVQAQLIQSSTAQFWQIVTAIGLTITPLLAKLGHVIATRIDMRASESAAPDEESAGAGRVVLFGYGRVGEIVSDMLAKHNQPYVAIESNVDVVAAARRKGVPILFGDVARPELLDRLRLGHAKALILTMDDPVLAVRIVRRVAGWVPDLTIIARARDANHAAELYRAGATLAVPEALESSLQLSEALLVDLGIAMGPVIASIHEKRDELRRKIMQEGELSKQPLLKSGEAPAG